MSYTISTKEAVHVFTESERRELVRVAKMQALAACWRHVQSEDSEFADEMVNKAIRNLVLDAPTFEQVIAEAMSEGAPE